MLPEGVMTRRWLAVVRQARLLVALLGQGGIPTADDAPADRLRLEQEALVLLMKGSAALGVTALLGAPMGAWLLQGFIGPLWAWGPAVVMLLTTVERLVFLHRLKHSPAAREAAQRDPRGAARAIIWRFVVTGSVFNLWSYATTQSPEFMSAIYMLGIALIMATSAMTQLCLWPAAVWAYITPLLLGLGWQLWAVGDAHGDGRLAGGVLLIVLWVMLIVATQRFSANMQRELRTRLRNEELLAELETKHRQAEAASAAKSRFLAAASHDLRQPVHAMSLLGQTLSDRLEPTEHAPLMRQMLTGVALFSQLVDEVMDLARADAPDAQAHMTVVRMRDLLERAETAFRPTSKARHLALWLRLPAGPEPLVNADAALAWRVLGNLLANAVRYTPQGGVMVAVRRAHMPDGRAAWRLEVRDSGPGIPAAQREAVFEEFYRAHDTHRAGGEGHGLGLAVAQRMAQLMGTQVRLQPASQRGHGSVFSITLEAAPADAGWLNEAAPSSATLSSLQPGYRVLVVEDDPLAREALRALLGDWGVRVEAAADARQAGQLARRAASEGAPFDALVTDHWLAEGELSDDVISAVRTHAPDLRVAVVSGGADIGDAQALSAQGITFWRKPLRPPVLHAWLSEEGGVSSESGQTVTGPITLDARRQAACGQYSSSAEGPPSPRA